MLQAALSNTLVHNSLWQLGNNNVKNRGGERKNKNRPTSVVWHSFAQSLSSPSQISHTSLPAPGQTVCAFQ